MLTMDNSTLKLAAEERLSRNRLPQAVMRHTPSVLRYWSGPLPGGLQPMRRSHVVAGTGIG